MHSGGTAHLSHAADGVLHFLGGGQHQVCQLIDDHHHGGQCLPLLAVFVRLGLLRQSVVGGQILHTVFGEQLVPLHHLKHRPLQCPGGLFGIGDHGDQQVGDAVIGGQLHHLGVHHDEPNFLRSGFIQQAHNKGVGANRLAGAGGAGNKYMGELGDVSDDAVAADVLAHGESHGGLVPGKLTGFNDIPDAHRGHGTVGHLNAHGRYLARHRSHTHAAYTQSQRDVIGKIGDLGELHALRLRELIPGDAGTANHLPGLRIHAEAAEGVRQPLGIAAHFGAGLGEAARRALFQQGDGRILVLLLRLGQLLLDLAADLLGGLLEVHGSDSRLGLGRPGLGGRFLLGGLQHFVRGGGLPPGKEGLLFRLQGMILREGGIFSVQGDVNL